MSNEIFRRSIRIIGDREHPSSHFVSVYDAYTGKEIPGITQAVIYVRAGHPVTADITCYETNEKGQVVITYPDVSLGHHQAQVEAIEVSALEKTQIRIGAGKQVCFAIVNNKPYVHFSGKDGQQILLNPQEALNALTWLESLHSYLINWLDTI